MQVPFAEIVVGSDGALRRIDPILATGARTAFGDARYYDIRRHFPERHYDHQLSPPD